MRLTLSFAMFDLDLFVEKCQRVYFPIDGYSSADFITVHAALSAIIKSSSQSGYSQLGISRSEAQDTISLCRRNVMAALEQSSIFLQPCMDNIAALVYGVRQPRNEAMF